MMTIPQLLKYTLPKFKKGSQYVSLKKVRTGTNKAGFDKIMATAYSTRNIDGKPKSGPPQQHIVGLTALTDKSFKGAVKVSCSCEAFTYTCEVALHKHGASDIFYSNGDAPDTTNPKMIPTLCKHLYVLCSEVSSGGF